jgi:hypothetical protein
LQGWIRLSLAGRSKSVASNSHLTAIYRTDQSSPVKWLLRAGKLTGRVLDYGCGRGFDAESIFAEKYDPHYYPDMPAGRFDTIMCNYVLCTLEDERERRRVLIGIAAKLREDGLAYITVRSDKNHLHGWTGRGTWQGYIRLGLPITRRGPHFTIYRFTCRDVHCKMLADLI